MSDESPYTKRELDSKFEAIHERFGNQDRTLEKILTQTTLHNGRMKKIEKTLLIVGCVSATILIINGSELVDFLMKVI